MLALAACGETVFRRGMERVSSMDPAAAASLYAARAVQLVYEPLLEFDYAARPYRLAPGLADSLPEGLPCQSAMVANAALAAQPG